jgi:YegS/Rv2252/BmrU family lipid kinase
MLFIINPTSAGGRTQREWEEVRKVLTLRHVAFAEHLTTRPGEATEVARNALGGGCDCVVAVGGDGTLNEVVNGYFDDAGKVINASALVGLLPSGTGSDFRRSIGLATRDQALSALLCRRQQLIDVVRVEVHSPHGALYSRYLVNVASFGLGGEAVALVNSWRGVWPRMVGGRLRFTAAALLALKNYRNVGISVRFDDAGVLDIRSGFFVVANGRFAGGGMMFAPRAELNDGLLDVVLTDRVARWEIVKELPRIQRGAHLQHPKVSLTRARTLEVTSETPIAVDIDGEFAGYTPARLTVVPSAVRFIVPALAE